MLHGRVPLDQENKLCPHYRGSDSALDLYAIGTSETREVSLFQRLICTQEYTIETSETVLIREVSLFQRLIFVHKSIYY